MNGLLIYELKEIERNRSFIDRLIHAAKSHDLNLNVIDDQHHSIPDTDFIFFRARNPKLAKTVRATWNPNV